MENELEFIKWMGQEIVNRDVEKNFRYLLCILPF